ncbi:bpX5 domain-containing protein [Pseudomonas sp. CGJS7]|uniref:bpX5 domain-containing protein n=1 Tax=Pseudomonas sp. CGJS7 TaxID=3109348 RepID=UPI00300A6D36
MKWNWRAQDQPPPPQAAVGIGASAARALLRAVERLDEDVRDTLMLTANADVAVIAGAAAQLPWFEGVAYAAPCEQAPGLWLLTTERPDVPLDLLQRAIARLHPQTPLLLLREPAQIVPLHRALPASAALIAQIRAHWQD